MWCVTTSAASGRRELQVHGSIQLARTLHEAGLVDVYRLLVAPVVVGSGAGLFRDTSPAHTLTVIESQVTENGVVALELEPGGLRTGIAVIDDGRDAIA